MTIKLRPEHEQMISEALNCGAYQNPAEVIGRALEILALEDEWLRENHEAVQAKIARGLAQLDRGEGIPGEESRVRLQEKKSAWVGRNGSHRG
ncbi:MAG TPA: type II toxin-antitoxin system ParD family antitoxin [Terriglobia bacterium]|nr:type II toxin-antitoxin system ParD family antitoxin [Terriglobia bacterium]